MADSYLRCTVCGRTSTTDFASSLRTGWERCCGYTMRLERTDADIEAAVASAFDGAEVVSAARSGENGPHGRKDAGHE
jgi:hypothetical protein